VRETFLLDIPHRQIVFVIPKMLWTERILSWRHTGFSVHSRVRAKTKLEADASSRWVEGIILITRFAQLAQLKRKLLFF